MLFCLHPRKRSRCFYGDNPYEEAKYSCDREAHYFIPNPVHEKRRSPTELTAEQFEMTSPVHAHVHAHGDGQYGTMSVSGTNRPPAYTPPLTRSTFASIPSQRVMGDRGRSITVDPRSPGAVEKCEHHYSR